MSKPGVLRLDLTERQRAEAEIRALKDQLYKENLVLRDEVDKTSMFEEIVGSVIRAESRAGSRVQGRAGVIRRC